MAQPSVDNFDSRVIAIKASGTPTSASDSFELFDGSCGVDVEVIERPRDSSTMTNDDFVVSKEIGFVEGAFELAPPVTPGSSSGTAGQAPAERALLPCALALALSSVNSTSRYTPISTAIPTANVKFWQGGEYHLISNVNGNISSLEMVVGQKFRAGGFRVQGESTTVDEDAVPTDGELDEFLEPATITYDNSVTRIFQGTSTTALPLFVHGRSLVVDLGNEVASTEFTQLLKTGVRRRKGTFTLVIARTDLDDFDPWAVRRAGTIIRADMSVIDDDATRYSRLFIRGKIEGIQKTDTDGYYSWTITGRCLASAAGGDDYGIEYGLDSLRLIGDLPDGTDDIAYSAQLSLQGVYGGPVTYTVHSGALPTGLSLSSTTGVVSGTPTTADDYTFVIRATTTDITGAAITADSASQVVTIAA